MSKGLFGKHDVNWHNDYRCHSLKHPAYKWLNFVLWQCCVRERCMRLPCQYNASLLARESGIDRRTIPKALKAMEELKLIKVNSDQSIDVYGVREKHETPNFSWKDIDVDIDVSIDVYIDADTNVDIDAPKNSIDKDKDIDKEKEKHKRDALVQEICDYYKSNIRNEYMTAGKKNLISCQKKTKHSFETLFQSVKNYHQWTIREDKGKFVKNMRNFFGVDEVFSDFIEMPSQSKSKPLSGEQTPEDERLQRKLVERLQRADKD